MQWGAKYRRNASLDSNLSAARPQRERTRQSAVATQQRRCACAIFLLCLVTAVAAPAQTLTTLVSFDGSNGGDPLGVALVQGRDGNLYGATQYGGAHTGCSVDFPGCGTIFKVTTGGTLTTLYSFCAQPNCTDGDQPAAGLILGTDGNFYGTTQYGGQGTSCPYAGLGCGTIFRITPGGTLTTLYSFCVQPNCADGRGPDAPLFLASDGNFYGTTTYGGATTIYCQGCGTIFKLTPGGTLTTPLYSFCSQASCADGAHPTAGLVQGTDGNLYGTTFGGGNTYSNGTAFKITTTGTLTTFIKFQFNKHPAAGLVQATDGYFYGTSNDGGYGKSGTVFKMSSTGAIKKTYSFCMQANCTDGAGPAAPLVQGTDGNFYGTTSGTIFQITPDLILTTLHTFSSNFQDPGGSVPQDGLAQATDGNFYGTTLWGGASNNCGGTYNCGTVFRLTMGLGPFVKPVPNSGKVGTTIRILGTSLKGATSVSFNGTAATFTVVSATQIATTVPNGATTGTVTVTTPSATLKSNVVFQVK